MNRYIFLTVVLGMLVCTSSTVIAQTTTPTTTPAVTPTTPVTKQPFTPEPVLQKIAQTRLLNLAANMSNRMDSTVNRLQNLINRLNSRLEKMESEGKSMANARVEIGLAQTKLEDAKRNLTTIDTEVNAFIGSATPRENWQNLKKTYLNTQAAIVASHQSILAAINLAQTTSSQNETIISTTTATSTVN